MTIRGERGRLLRGHPEDGQSGFLLLPVMLLIAVLAAAIFLLARENVSSLITGSREAEVNAASLVAEAGLRHAVWQAVSSGTCSGYADLVDIPFGEHTYSAAYSRASGSPLSVTATGVLASGTTHEVTSAQQRIYEGEDTLLLQPGPEGKGSFIENRNPDDNYGADSWLYTDSEEGGPGPTRALIQFDLSSIPAFAEISSAELQLYVFENRSDETDIVEAHRLTREWTEGDGGSGVSWNSFDGISDWSTPGGDYDTEIAGSFLGEGTGWKSMTLTGLVQDWVTGTVPNYGVLLLSQPASGNNPITYFSGDNPDETLRPKLIVSYACECGSGKSGTTVMQPAGAGKDTSLRNRTAAEGTTNYGSDPDLSVSTDGGQSLLRFDLSGIPENALIESAELELHFDGADSLSSAELGIHEVTRDWAEAETTWFDFQSGENWTTPGGDHEPLPAGTTTVNATPDTRYTWDATSLVVGWTSGATPNNGLLLRVTSGVGDVINARFSSSDSATAADHPKLTVNYRCPCGVDCTSGGPAGTYCDADFAADAKSFNFDWQPAAGEISGIEYLPAGLVINGVTIPAGGGWIMTDRNKDQFFVTDHSGVALTDFPTVVSDPYGVAYVESGTWAGHLAVAELSDDAVYFIDLDGAVVGSFLTVLFARKPFGLSYIGETATGAYNDHLAISSDDGGGTIYIVDQEGTLKTSIDVDSHAPQPQGVTHLTGSDKFMVADRDGLISIVNYAGTLLNQYDAVTWAYDELRGLTIDPSTCDHVLNDKNASIVAGLNTRDTAAPGNPRLLMAVARAHDLSAHELAKKTRFEFWGFKVTVIDDNASSTEYDQAVVVNDVVFVGEDVSASKIGGKLTDSPIGVVNEEANLSEDLALSTTIGWSGGTVIDIDNTGHYITAPLAPGPLDLLSDSADMAYLNGTLAPGLTILGSTAAGPMLATLEAGDLTIDSLPAAGRRVQLPWGESNFEFANLTTDGETILRRALNWGTQRPILCDADFAANNLVDDFPWMTGTGDLHGIDYIRAGLTVNTVSIPSGGGWIMSDKGKDELFVTDLDGNPLTNFPVKPANSQGIAVIDSGSWIHYIAMLGEEAHGNDRVYYLDLDGNIEWSFLIEDTISQPLGLTDIGTTDGGVYDDHLAISSDKNLSGGGTATAYILDPSGVLKKTIDIEAYAPTPQGIRHLPGTDKLLVTDKNGLVSIIDFDGNLLRQYTSLDFELTELNDVAINPMTCEHVIVDRDTKTVASLNQVIGSGAHYIEMTLPWEAVTEDTWETINLGIYGVLPNSVAEVAVVNYDGGKELWGGVRAAGSTLERRLQLHEAGGGGVDAMVVHVQTDADGFIEYYSDDQDKLSFILLGFWTGSAYEENWQVFTAGVNSSWVPHTLNTYGVNAGDVAEILMVNNDGFARNTAGVRTDGSGANRLIELHDAEEGGDEGATLFSTTGADAGATVEVYAKNDADIDFYLLGHWSTPPGTYTEVDFEKLGTPSVDRDWEDTDLSSRGVPANAVVQIALANRQIDKKVIMGVRSAGSLRQRLLELHKVPFGGHEVVTMQVRTDASSVIQWYEKDILLNHEFYLLGWWQLP